MSELVSILIPAYNAEKWIADTIKSAIGQTWPNKEVIIVDDGSKDRTLQIAKQFESKSVKVISQENKGAAAARNKALELAQGDYIQWLDGDDLLAPDKITLQLNRAHAIGETKTLLSSAFGMFYHKIETARFQTTPLWQNMSPVEWFIKSFEGRYWMQTAVWLVSRDLTEAAGPWDERLSYNDDGEYFGRVIAKSHYIQFISESCLYYRIYIPGSLSNFWKKSERTLKSENLSSNLSIDQLLGLENSERTRKAAINKLENLISMMFPYSYLPAVKDMMAANYERILSLGGEVKKPSETMKYYVTRKLLGLQNAELIKKFVWWARCSFRRNLDRRF